MPSTISKSAPRWMGWIAVMLGIVVGTTGLTAQAIAHFHEPIIITSQHETTYVMIRFHFGWMLVCCVSSILLGAGLICLSRAAKDAHAEDFK